MFSAVWGSFPVRPDKKQIKISWMWIRYTTDGKWIDGGCESMRDYLLQVREPGQIIQRHLVAWFIDDYGWFPGGSLEIPPRKPLQDYL